MICHYCSKKATQAAYCDVCTKVSSQRQLMSAIPCCDLHTKSALALSKKHELACARVDRKTRS